MATTTTSSAGVRWDLGDLCADAAAAAREWEELLAAARDLAGRFRGRVASLDAAGLRELLDELDGLEERQARVQFYAVAREHTEATSEEAADLATSARERAAELENLLLFADLEWLELEDARAEELLAAPELAPYEHKLRVAREEKPYVLGEAEEQALNARRPVAAAWEALHGRQLATLTVPFDAGAGEEPHTIDRLLAYVYEPRRELRLASVDALYAGLQPRADVLAASYDALALPEGYRLGWSYIPHFIHVRFYTYAYAFAHLVAFSLLARYREDPERFAPAYLEFLAAGGSRSPQELLEPTGVDLRDPATWDAAFGEFERCIAEAEAGSETLRVSSPR